MISFNQTTVYYLGILNQLTKNVRCELPKYGETKPDSYTTITHLKTVFNQKQDVTSNPCTILTAGNYGMVLGKFPKMRTKLKGRRVDTIRIKKTTARAIKGAYYNRLRGSFEVLVEMLSTLYFCKR